MKDYQKYFLMKTEDICDYVQTKVDFFTKNAELIAEEIGDGNLNYVFKITEQKTNKSIIVKQAGETLRISADLRLSTDRGRIEADILTIENKLAPHLVPRVYLYDSVMCAIIMEDMINHSMLRTALIQHEIFPHFSENISTFLANTLWLTTDLVMDTKEKKELVRKFINPDLCELTEEFVFSAPFTRGSTTNSIFAPMKDFVEKEVFSDEQLSLEVSKLKVAFKNNAQSLIHGDLHSGSIFINQDHLYVFDPEFAFFGPMGYDIGNVIANMGFALMNGLVMIADECERERFTGWIRSTIKEIPDKFKEKVKELHFELTHDPKFRTEAFFDWYLSDVMTDAAGVCGLETMRRIVGMAKVKDITSIENELDRTYVERALILYAKDCIKNRCLFKSGQDYLNAIDQALMLAK